MPRFAFVTLRAAAILAGLLLACGGNPSADGDRDAPPADAEQPADSTAAKDVVIPAPGELPPGGLADWISDIRRGLARLPGMAASDPAAAQRVAIDLYAGRQEYIEIFYGTGGRLTAGESLGPAVMSAEAKFHELMVLLAGSPPPDSTQVRAAVTALGAEYDRVLEEAAGADVPMKPDSATLPSAAK